MPNEEDAIKNVGIIEENDPRVKIIWKKVLGKSLSKIIREKIFLDENRNYDSLYDECHLLVFDCIEKYPSEIPARKDGIEILVSKKIAERNFELTLSSVYSSIKSYLKIR